MLFVGIYQTIENHGFLTDAEGKTKFGRSAICSGFAGATGAFCGSPLFLVKTQLQSQAAAEIAVGTQHGHTGALRAIKTIYHENGVGIHYSTQ